MIHKFRFWLSGLLLVVFMFSSEEVFSQNLKKLFPKTLQVKVTNPLNQPRESAMVFVSEADIKRIAPKFNPKAFVVLDGGKEIASQYNLKADKGIVLVLDNMAPDAAHNLTIRYHEKGEVKRDYKKRTQAEISHKVGGKFEKRKYIGGEFRNVDSLRVPAEHTDHSFYIRYEGPGWESDKVGYRFYLDWRNGVDVFGKRTNDMVLQQVGLDGFDSYHELQPWGMDVLKVASSLGVGSLAMFHNGEAERIAKTDSLISKVVENGPVYSSIQTGYYGWQVAGQELDLHSTLSIHAGTRLSHQQVQLEGGNPQNISTGLINDKKAKLFTNKGNGKQWGYIATYGKQSLNGEGDNLGIAVLYNPKDLIEITQDKNSHVVVLKPEANKAEYYFLAAWELEPDGIKTGEQFIEYLNKAAQELANPVKVSLSRK